MPIEHGVDGAGGRDLDGVRQSSEQALADLASSPGWLLAPDCDDCRLNGFGKLMGVSKGPPSPVTQAVQAALLITLQESYAQSCEKDRISGTETPSARRLSAGSQSACVHPSQNISSMACFTSWLTEPKCVTHVSGTFCYLCLGTVTKGLALCRAIPARPELS